MRLPGTRSPLVIAAALAAVTTASAGGWSWVTVHSGDTLSTIAAKHHTSVSELVALNHLPGNGNLIYAGSRLRVPSRHHHAGHHGATHHAGHHHASHHGAGHHHARHHRHRAHAGHGASSSVHRVVGHYTVRPGDSVTAIADRWHVPAQRIVTANHLTNAGLIRIGQDLRIPHWVHGAAEHHHHSAHHYHHGTAHHRHHATHGGGLPAHIARIQQWLAHRSVPSRDHVSALIRRVAAQFHVPASFALAISWQESGFNQREVSSSGAIGAMQVVPSTGRFVSTYVVHRRLHLLDAHDNVVAGIGLLSVLLQDTHGDQRLAAAGYYQGLASVRAQGMFRDTKQYVADVLALRQRF